MTTHQLIALGFPLLTVVAVGVVGLVVRRLGAEKSAAVQSNVEDAVLTEALLALEQAESLIQKAERNISRPRAQPSP